MNLTVATRSTPLALYQTQEAMLYLKDCQLSFDLMPIVTDIDKKINTPLSSVGKSAFTGALEEALISKKADMAVHSLKDLGVHAPGSLECVVFLLRSFPQDIWLSNQYQHPKDAPEGTVVGTSSQRRYWLLKHAYPHLDIKPIRGSIGKRMDRLKEGDYDALVLAKAGVARLGLSSNYQHEFNLDNFIPSPGQGVIVIQMDKNHDMFHTLSKFSDPKTKEAALLERKIVHDLGGHCKVPLGVYAYWNQTWHVAVQLSYEDESILVQKHHDDILTLYSLITKELIAIKMHEKIKRIIGLES